MKRTTVVACCLYATLLANSFSAHAQDQKKQESSKPSKNKAEQKCRPFDYHIDVVTLDTNHEEMYWKQNDCIRVFVTNNPFLFKYKLEFNEQLIPEDDPLGAFGKTLGINVSTSANGGSTHTDPVKKAAPASATGGESTFNFVVKPHALTPEEAKKHNLALEEEKKREAEVQLKNLAKLEDWKKRVEALRTKAGDIEKTLRSKTKTYLDFSIEVPKLLNGLMDQAANADEIRKHAESLRDKATTLLGVLSDGEPGSIAASSTYEGQMLDFARAAAPLHAEIDASEDSVNAENIRRLMDQVHSASQTVVFTACRYKTERDNDFDSVRTRLLAPLNNVLNDPFAFGYDPAADKREGPFGDPTLVQVKLTRDEVHPFTTDDKKNPANTTSSFTCSSDPADMFENGSDYNTFEDFFTDKMKKGAANLYTRNQNAPKPTSQKSSTPDATKAAASDAPTTVVLEQPWYFGKARLVLTGGLTTGFLGKQEFQRSSSISGGTSQTVVGLKTDTRYRFTPMLYGHTLLYSTRHDSDAWYATFGVTANSDSKGTSPEFLLGGSRSFVQQRFFFTLGAYFGEKQKLDGGLQVGQVIPATLTGELPVTKSYHAGWGFGISYRFASTKNPQKDSSTPAKQTSGGTKKSGN